jgi:hypothetical protein
MQYVPAGHAAPVVQHGLPMVPHVRHWLLGLHAVPDCVHTLPPQHGCPSAPHGGVVHVPALHTTPGCVQFDPLQHGAPSEPQFTTH